MLSQAGWGETDYVGHLEIRKASPDPLHKGCFIWSQKIGLALTASTEHRDKESTELSGPSLHCSVWGSLSQRGFQEPVWASPSSGQKAGPASSSKAGRREVRAK